MYVIADYSDIVAFGLIAVMATGIVWAVRHHVLRIHPLILVLLVIGGLVYFNLPRIMFDHPDGISLDDVSPRRIAQELGPAPVGAKACS